jgi:hypothetical protein
MIRFRTLCAVLVMAVVCASASRPLVERWRFEHREDARLHAHFACVLTELAERDVSRLDAAQRTMRVRLLSLLREYDRHGRFPRNEGQRPDPTPIFVDRHGTRCAMAYLIENAGGASLVARIAAIANLARIPELAGDSELVRWLAGAGLDLAEAARIQPSYGGPPPSLDVIPASNEKHVPGDGVMLSTTLISAMFAARTLVVGALPARTANDHRRAAHLALSAGTLSLALGMLDGLNDGHLRGSGCAHLALGATTLTLGVLELRHARRLNQGTTDAGGMRAAPAVRTGPMGEPQVGFQLSF